MKNLWIVSLIIGTMTLFFFPEPQKNFLYYLITAGLFIALTVILYKKQAKSFKFRRSRISRMTKSQN